MISENLRFEGVDSRSWTNLISLFAPNVPARMASDAAASDAPELEAQPIGPSPKALMRRRIRAPGRLSFTPIEHGRYRRWRGNARILRATSGPQ